MKSCRRIRQADRGEVLLLETEERTLTSSFKAVKRAITPRLRLWVSIAISLAFLVVAFKNVQLSEVTGALAKTNYSILILALGTVVATMLGKAARWRLLFFPHQAQLRFGKIFSVLLIGQTTNVLLPTRLGDLARAYLIGEIEGVDKALAFCTVVMEKVVDSLMLLLLFAVLLPMVPLPPWFRWSGVFISLALVVLFLVVLVVACRGDQAGRSIDSLLRWVPGFERLGLSRAIQSAIEGLALFRSLDVDLKLLGWSAIISVSEMLTNYFTLLALGISLPLSASLFLLIVLRFGAAIPSSPGKVGVFHYLCVLALSAFAVDKALALSYGFVLHFLVFVPMILLGTMYLWKENYDLQRLASLRQDAVACDS